MAGTMCSRMRSRLLSRMMKPCFSSSGEGSSGVMMMMSRPSAFNNFPVGNSSGTRTPGLREFGKGSVVVPYSHYIHTTARHLESVKCRTCSHSYSTDYVSSEFIEIVTCPKCGALQRLEKSQLPDYFRILDRPRSYRMDLQFIANKTKQLQKKFHPDLYSQKGGDQQILSQEYSTLINRALATLSDPIARGRYMLNLAGVGSPSSSDDDEELEKAVVLDPEFLHEVMDRNEKLEEVSTEQAWKEFRDQNVATLAEIQGQLGRAFDENNINKAQLLVGKMKFYDSLQEKLKDLQSHLGIVE